MLSAARHSQQQEDYGKQQLTRLKLARGDRVLDIGCGDGRITAALAQRVPEGRVVGVRRETGMPYPSRLKPKQRQPFLDRYLELHPIDANGLVHVGMVNLLVKATKA